MKTSHCFNRTRFFSIVRIGIAGMLISAAVAFFRSEAPAKVSQRTLTYAERVAYQRAIEDIYWRHRIWPKERPDPKPLPDEVMPSAQLEKKVKDYLRNSQVLEDYWQRPLTAEQLQAEMDRMAQHTRQPEVLREIFAALGNDPFVIAECLARPVLSERLVISFYAHDQEPLESWRAGAENQTPKAMRAASGNYSLPTISDRPRCTDDTWTATSTTNAPDARASHTAVWTGSEMIVWGGEAGTGVFDTGGRYNPGMDRWTATSTTNAPSARTNHTAVWTGSEMIVWGGAGDLTTGGRYNPSMDSWIATSTTNAPTGRFFHTAVWSGNEMIVWGGQDSAGQALNTGGRYNPSMDSWIATSTTNAPTGRFFHTAVWSGSEMIVWGGQDSNVNIVNTGGRYNPSTDSWMATSTTNAPDGRRSHTAAWTGSEMIVWGGNLGADLDVNTGGRYNPGTDSWTSTSITNAPTGRIGHKAVWTDSEMIVWGGRHGRFPPIFFNTGGRYNPNTNGWVATSTTNAPDARSFHTAVWSGSEMIVWGGSIIGGSFNTGGRYCAQLGPTPTPTPTPTPGQITLSARGYKVQGHQMVDLSWNGATSNDIDIYRNGVLIATVPNIPGFYTDNIGARGKGTYTYKICEAGTQNCSNQVTVRFGGG